MSRLGHRHTPPCARQRQFLIAVGLVVQVFLAVACATTLTTPPNDAAITARVKMALLNELEMSGSTIEVDTVAGVVTLTGRTPSATTAERADRVARSIGGGTDVVVRLQVDPSTP